MGWAYMRAILLTSSKLESHLYHNNDDTLYKIHCQVCLLCTPRVCIFCTLTNPSFRLWQPFEMAGARLLVDVPTQTLHRAPDLRCVVPYSAACRSSVVNGLRCALFTGGLAVRVRLRRRLSHRSSFGQRCHSCKDQNKPLQDHHELLLAQGDHRPHLRHFR